MAELPSGTVTFLFTDIEGSTNLLKQLGADLYGRVLADHRRILRAAFEEHNGSEIDTQGNSFLASFPRATEAVVAVVQIQRQLFERSWPEGAEVRVRMGLHTGEPWLIEEGYVGMDVHRAARIGHIAHGGQVLLSETTTSLVRGELPDGVALKDLGRHRLKDVRRPEPIQQLVIEGLPAEFPSLTSLELVVAPGFVSGDGEIRAPREVGESPYQGLAAFREEDARFFFGRESFTTRLMDTIQEQGLVTIIVGPSGSGKSSTIFAGLLPQLRESNTWSILTMRPGREPFQGLAAAFLPLIAPELSETDQMVEIGKMAQALRDGDLTLGQITERALSKNEGISQVLLVVDQFEELYTLCPDPDVRAAFHDELLSAVEAGSQGRRANFSLLLTLRADFMGQALGHRPFADTLQESSILLGPMTRDELRRAVEKPAEIQGAAFETGLVDRLLDDVGDEPGNLPLLEFALTLLWEQMEDGWLTHAAYDDIGQVEGSLARYANQVYVGLTSEEQAEARTAFVQLVQPGEGTEDTRRVARQDELVGVDWKLIQHLADERLVVTGLDGSGHETVEVVHEALIRSWGQLREWMDADREFRSWQEGLRGNMRQWEASRRDDGALLRGTTLSQAEDWIAERGDEIGPAETGYIRVSANKRDQQKAIRERRRRLIMAGLGIGLLVAVILSAFAFSQRGAALRSEERAKQNAATAQAETLAKSTAQVRAEVEADARATQQVVAETERARAEEETLARATAQARAEEQARTVSAQNLAVVADEKLTTDPQLGLLLALEAMEKTYSMDGTRLPEIENVLHRALQQASRLDLTIPAPGNRLPYVSYSPDGSRLIAHYVSSEAAPTTFPVNTETMIWDASTGELLYTFPEGRVVPQWPQGDEVAVLEITQDDNLEVTVWETIDGTEVSRTVLDVPQNLDNDQINALVMNSDQNRLSISWAGGARIGVWDLETGENESTILPLAGDGSFYEGRVGGNVSLDTSLPSYLMFTSDGFNITSLHQDDLFEESRSYIKTWELQTGELTDWKDFLDPKFKFVSPSEAGTLVGFPLDGHTQIQEIGVWEDLTLLLAHPNTALQSLVFSRDEKLIAAVGSDGNIYLWDLEGSIATSSSQLLLTLADPARDINDLAISPDGSRLASAGMDGDIRVWDILPDGGIELPAIGNPLENSTSQRTAIAISPDNHRLAIAKPGESVSVWDTDTREALYSLPEDMGSVEDIAFSPDGNTLATCSHAGPMSFWDAETGRQLFSFDGYNDGKCTVSFHPDSSLLALGFFKNGAGWYQVLELPDLTQKPVDESLVELEFPWRGVMDYELVELEFNSNGTQVAGVNNNGEFFLWDPWLEDETYMDETGVVDRSEFLNDGPNYLNIAFSPKGDRLFTTGIDGTLTFWDTQSMELIRSIPAHSGKVTVVSVGPEGSGVATGSTDGSIKIWNPETGQNILALPAQTDGITDIVFSSDGKRLYAANASGIVSVYLLDPQDLLELANSRLTRMLTDEECQIYLQGDECP